jgi:putative flippase GtrA
MLFGFLLALPFTTRFTKLDTAQRDLYKASLFFAAISTALLVAPVAYHRWVFRRHEKGKLLRFANVLAILGLAAVAAAISLAVCLIMTVVGNGWIVTLMVGCVSLSFVILWFVVPIIERLTSNPASFD